MLGFDIKTRVSRSKKESSNFARQKDIMDAYDIGYGTWRDDNKIGKYKINYDLYNGRLDVNLYKDKDCFKFQGEEFNLELGSITHYPLISQIARAMHGEMINRDFRPTAKDVGAISHNIRRKKWNEIIRERVEVSILRPIQEEATSNYFKQYGIVDPTTMSPEQQQQAMAEIQGRISQQTPDEIMKFMNDFQTPSERQAQRLLDYLVERNSIKYKQEEGFKDAIIVGEEIYYVGDRNDEPVFEKVNPMFFTWGGSQNTEWVQEGQWAKYEQWITRSEAIQRYSQHLSESDLKALEGFMERIGGGPKATTDKLYKQDIDRKVQYEVSYNSSLYEKYGAVDIKTKEGQEKMKAIYNEVGRDYAGVSDSIWGMGIREAHIVWRDKRLLYRVTRIEDGKERKYWVGENYTQQPKDIKVQKVWVDEIWEGTKLGTGPDPLYVNIRPLPSQYKSVYDPYGVELPYFGKQYNTHQGNSKNVSIVDLGKPWQMEFDTEMANIKHDLSTNVGRIFIMATKLKPEGMTTKEWIEAMRNFHLLFIDTDTRGLNSMDPSLLKGVDLSKVSDLANRVQLLETFKQNLISSMLFNNARIGAVGQYATNENIQISNVASYNQTEYYFETHRIIVQKALNAFMNRAKYLYKDKDFKTSFILNDVERVDLELTPDFWYSELGVTIMNSNQEAKEIDRLKTNLLSFTQNGMSIEGILDLSFAKTRTDVVDIIKRENKKAEDSRKAAMEQQQQMIAAEAKAKLEQEQFKQQSEAAREKAQLDSQERRTIVDVEKFRKQADANNNNQADMIEKTILEITQRAKEHADKMELEREKLQVLREKQSSEKKF